MLDITSGTGEPALTAAQLVRHNGTVIGTDLSEDTLSIARNKATILNLENVQFRCMDGEEIAFPPETFDAFPFAGA